MVKLTHKQIEGLASRGRYGDGGGLYLNIAPGGSKSWVQRITIDGKRTDKGLGGFPAVSLAEARHIAKENKAAVKEGRNPWDGAAAPVLRFTEADGTITFAEATRRTYRAKVDAGVLKNVKHRSNWIRRLEMYALPVFGNRPVDEITRREMVAFVEGLHATGHIDTAQRVRAGVREVLDDCVEREETSTNHAGEAIRRTVARLGKAKQTKHQRALYHDKVADALVAMRQFHGMKEPTLALHFLVLTASRSGEVRGATWDEIDLDAAVWTIPGNRMKANETHRVPLTIQAQMILHQAKALARERARRRRDRKATALIFPHPNGNPLSDQVFSQRLNKLALDTTAHGFRSSFNGYAAEQGWPPELISKALAHKVGSAVAQAYNRVDLLEQRRPMMEQWGSYIDPLPF